MLNAHVGGYEVVRRISSGARAEIFEATRLLLGGMPQRVALKRIKSELLENREYVSQLVKNATTGSRLVHPNIVGLQELHHVDGQIYVSMEYVRGISLEVLIAFWRLHHQLPGQAKAACIMAQLLDGLAFAHRCTDAVGHAISVLHRDLKPANILINRQGLVKIADFGVAKPEPSASSDDADMLPANSGPYRSPEQVEGLELTTATDLYSAGAIFYELLTLEPLFQGTSPTELSLQISSADLEPKLQRLQQDYPEVYPIVRRALAHRPLDRFESAEVFRNALTPFYALASDRQLLAQSVREIYDAQGATKSDRERLVAEEPSLRRLEEAVQLQGVGGAGLAHFAETDYLGVDVELAHGVRAYTADRKVMPTAVRSASLEMPLQESLGQVAAQPMEEEADVELELVEDAVDDFSEVRTGRWKWVIASAVATVMGLSGAALSGAFPSLTALIPTPMTFRTGPELGSAVPGEYRFVFDSEMVHVPAGQFRAGLDNHLETVGDFFMDRYEVTVGQYLRFLEACPVGSACGPSALPSRLAGLSPAQMLEKTTVPITGVAFSDAQAYAAWAGKRLPSSLEWEKAARGVDGRAQPWGPLAPPAGLQAFFTTRGGRALEGKASVLDERFDSDRSPYGVMGMAGGVSEWVVGETESPTEQLLAGGHFGDTPAHATVRRIAAAATRVGHLGFRCVTTLADGMSRGKVLAASGAAGALRLATADTGLLASESAQGGSSGFEPAMLSAVTQPLGTGLTVVSVEAEALIAGLLAHNYDLIVGDSTMARAREVVWSAPILEVGTVLLVPMDAKPLAPSSLLGKRVGISARPGAEEVAKGIQPGIAVLRPYSEGILKALAAREIDAALLEEPEARALLEQQRGVAKIVYYNLSQRSLRIGVRPGEWSLFQAIQLGVTNETLEARSSRIVEKLGGAQALATYGPFDGPTVKVEPGDNLMKLAERALGDPTRRLEILAANQAWLKGPDQLRAGMVLKVPAQ